MTSARRLLVGALLVAGVGTLGSLFLSEGLGLRPCELCWYQRALLYPQLLVIGGALIRPRYYLPVLAFGMSLAGAGIAAYHSWLQLQPAPVETCSLANPCSAVSLEIAGLSIPNLSLVTFLALCGLLGLGLAREYRQ